METAFIRIKFEARESEHGKQIISCEVGETVPDHESPCKYLRDRLLQEIERRFGGAEFGEEIA